jgi:hypothetical protein
MASRNSIDAAARRNRLAPPAGTLPAQDHHRTLHRLSTDRAVARPGSGSAMTGAVTVLFK